MSGLPIASPKETRAWLVGLLRPRAWRVAGSVLVLIAAAVAGLVLPATLGRIVDAVLEPGTQPLGLLIALVAVAGVVHAALTALSRMLVGRLGEDVLAELRLSVVSRLLRLPAGVVENAGRGDLVSRASGDARVVGDVVSSLIPAFAGAAFSIVVTVVGLGAINPWFALAAMAAVPVQVVATRRYLRRARPLYLAAREAEGTRSRAMLESVDAADTVRAMRISAEQERDVDAAAARVVGAEVRAAKVAVTFWNQLNIAELVGLAAVLTAGFVLVQSNATTIGGATAAALYFHALFGPIGSVLGGIDELQMAGAALSRMVGVLRLPERAERRVRSDRGPVDVDFDGVGFAYGEGFRLDDVSFTLPAGQSVALVGASGAGKSTIAALLLGSRTPEQGTLTMGGLPCLPGNPMPRIGLAGQEPHVFACSVAENLRLARPDADESALQGALAQVDASGWVDVLPDGIDTVVGEGGENLTLVQAQQVALARLLLHDPDVLVLDEATAAAGGGVALDGAVTRLVEGRTTLAIAHRLDQAERADHVVVLDAGRVVEQGSHDDLVDAGSHYARIWDAWSLGASEETPAAP